MQVKNILNAFKQVDSLVDKVCIIVVGVMALAWVLFVVGSMVILATHHTAVFISVMLVLLLIAALIRFILFSCDKFFDDLFRDKHGL
jgi:hypothetical protein